MPPVAVRKPHVEAWLRELENDRLEIFLKIAGVRGVTDTKIRAHGEREAMLELIDWFEARTGMHVEDPKRRRSTGPRPTPGQMTMTIGERPLEDEGDGELS